MRNTVLLACVLVFLTACAGGSQEPAAASEKPFDEAAVLSAADRADGAEDRVVGKCAVCKLGMDGSSEFASAHAGYSFHLCSAHCKETFDHDPVKVLKRLPAAKS
jgi:YHS domain-containing protein